MNTKNYNNIIKKIYAPLSLCVLILVLHLATFAQSTNQNYPTAVISNEISGKIPARGIGDSRLTRYFYRFDGNQGDIFINVVTSNLNGDIDIFTADNLRPLTKIVVYADSSENETGRVIYLRKPEKLILRVEGRTPNDEAGTFRIKFAGSFEPLRNVAQSEEPELPEVKTENRGSVRVNSAGVIIETKPEPPPQPTKAIAERDTKETAETVEAIKETATKEIRKTEKSGEEKVVEEKADAVDTEEIAEKTETIDESKRENSLKVEPEIKETPEPTKPDVQKENTEITKEATVKTKRGSVKTKSLENIRLIVLLKNGKKFERRMSEVFSVNVSKEFLTVITSDGKVERFSIFDVEKMTVE